MLDAKLVPGRFHEAKSAWLRSFALDDMQVLVVCRGPVRREAFDIFDRMGIRAYGMLLSEKDSVVYPRCLAPELRGFPFPERIHRVQDYMGAGQEEKKKRIGEITAIAKTHGYTHIFAGYGFMAEDAEFVEAVQQAGIAFLGPSARVIHRAGAKDQAKELARSLGNAVIPGVDDVSARALLRRLSAPTAEGSASDKAGSKAGKAAGKDAAGAALCALGDLAKEHGLGFEPKPALTPAQNAEALLQAGYAQTVELVSIQALQAEAEQVCTALWREHPGRRVRLKHIGGGGGKGQRVVSKADEVEGAVMDLLAESKVLAPGSNRNFLVELNVEFTRHNEIQLIGNGAWCLSLGGRDCSVQMHEQKLLEVSLTRELLEAEAAAAEGRAREILQGDMGTLERMETEAERFGEATGLDSVSTFECIVDGFDHFFMEMNTRIQVEHGVTELVYRLKFSNPDAPDECFYVDELIEAMALLSVHGARLPRPERVPRSLSSVEVRINATNAALQPHAGGVIRGWSKPGEHEIRFDQGIGARNPDTDSFIWYNLAGAYDSNIALLLCAAENRLENFERMAEILRCTELRGDDLHTNMEMQYGLLQWFIGRGVMAQPTTRFMGAYLPAIGALRRLAADIDLDVAFRTLSGRLQEGAARSILAAKQTLLLRPLQRLLERAHLLGGFLGRYDGVLWQRQAGGDVAFLAHPVHFLERLYNYLGLEDRPGLPPSEKIWSHDRELLVQALDFYNETAQRSEARSAAELDALFSGAPDARLSRGDDALWQRCVAAHRGHTLGLELLLLVPRIGLRSQFLEVGVDESLQPFFPDTFRDPEASAACVRALAPPPPAAGDEIVTPMGGTFYAREAPHLPPLVQVGDHFEVGQPLFIIEVMKMFNKIPAPFSGTVVESLVQGADGSVVKKGQVIFRIEPDERVETESPEAARQRRHELTESLLGG